MYITWQCRTWDELAVDVCHFKPTVRHLCPNGVWKIKQDLMHHLYNICYISGAYITWCTMNCVELEMYTYRDWRCCCWFNCNRNFTNNELSEQTYPDHFEILTITPMRDALGEPIFPGTFGVPSPHELGGRSRFLGLPISARPRHSNCGRRPQTTET